MKVLKDTFRPEMARIKRELEALRGLTVHVGIIGAEGDLIMIARVHEYGATITAKNVRNLTIPLTKEAKAAKSPRNLEGLEWVPGRQPGLSFLVRPRKRKARGEKGREQREYVDGKTKFDPADYDWLYMLVHSVNIPERSFIRASFDNGKDTLDTICKEAIDGIIRNGWTAQEAADYIGKWAMEMTREYFNTQLGPPKAAVTKLTTSQPDNVLFDSGRLYNSITYKVEGGAQA